MKKSICILLIVFFFFSLSVSAINYGTAPKNNVGECITEYPQNTPEFVSCLRQLLSIHPEKISECPIGVQSVCYSWVSPSACDYAPNQELCYSVTFEKYEIKVRQYNSAIDPPIPDPCATAKNPRCKEIQQKIEFNYAVDIFASENRFIFYLPGIILCIILFLLILKYKPIHYIYAIIFGILSIFSGVLTSFSLIETIFLAPLRGLFYLFALIYYMTTPSTLSQIIVNNILSVFFYVYIMLLTAGFLALKQKNKKMAIVSLIIFIIVNIAAAALTFFILLQG